MKQNGLVNKKHQSEVTTMKVNVMTKVFNEIEMIEAELFNEESVFYIDGDKIYFLKVKPTEIQNVYKAVSPIAILAEGINIVDKQQILNEIKKALTEMSFINYLTRVCDHKEEFNFNLIVKGESKVKNYR